MMGRRAVFAFELIEGKTIPRLSSSATLHNEDELAAGDLTADTSALAGNSTVTCTASHRAKSSQCLSHARWVAACWKNSATSGVRSWKLLHGLSLVFGTLW